MGWQKRAGGRVYDSLSGHGFFIGQKTGKCISYGVLKKKCSICQQTNETEEQQKPHRCSINHKGSSGSMEIQLALKIPHNLYEKALAKIHVSKMETDDDATTRSLLSHTH